MSSSLLRPVRVGCVALLAGALLGLAGCASPADDAYGGFPDWLPNATDGSNKMLTGSTASPAITVQGDPVLVDLPDGGTVKVTVVGPEVPGVGLPDPPEATVCTWRITLSEATVPLELDVAHFAARDTHGSVYSPQLVPDRDEPPSTLQPGDTVTFEVRSRMPVGEGIIQYAPDGEHPVASWDFIVEND
jgi:hypothetical protein